MKAVIALSGGQDSTTCLVDLVNRVGAKNVYPVFFDYGQRHHIEYECARHAVSLLHVNELEVVPVEALKGFGAAALTNSDISVNVDATGTGNVYAEAHGLPSTFVPGRNMIFLGLCAAYAAQVGAREIVTGACAADEAGYPDCRPDFIASMEETINVALGLTGTDEAIEIVAPLLHLTKAQTWELAASLGELPLIVHNTHTCYEGNHYDLHPWGYGCGKCGSCLEREKGWVEYQATPGGQD